MKYKISDLRVGDKLIFQSTKLQSNLDLYWTVTGINGNRIYIEQKEMGYDETWTIEAHEILHIEPRGTD